MGRCGSILKRISSGRIIICCIIAIMIVAFIRYGGFSCSKKDEMNASSVLAEIVDITELSTSEFQYKGIADIYSDESRTEVECRACYSAVVKVYVDVNSILTNVDTQNKTISIKLPALNFRTIIVDEQTIALLPSDADVEIDYLLRCCKEDVEIEAMESDELKNAATENLKATIEGLLYPILKTQNYTLIWE